MKRVQSIPNGSLCQQGGVVLIRLLLMHLAVFQAVLSCVPLTHLMAIGVSLTGVITGTEISATGISGALGLVSHDALTRLLHSGWWSSRQFMVAAVKLVTLVGGEGWLIVDETLIPKVYAKVIAPCAWDSEHALRRNVFGLRLVFIVWSHGWLTLPLGFDVGQTDPTRTLRPKKRRGKPGRPRKRGRTITSSTLQACDQRKRRQAITQAAQRKRPRTAMGAHSRTKNAWARLLVWQVVRAGVKATGIVFDTWYASRENLRGVRRLDLPWVTSLKRTTKVLHQGQPMTVQKVANSVAKLNDPDDAKRGARVRSFEVGLYGSPVTLTVIKDDTHEEAGRTKYLATNELGLTHTEHVGGDRRRWPSEVLFRDAKQLLGLGRSQARTAQAVLTHLVLGCLGSVALPRLTPLGAKPHVSVSKKALCALRLWQSPQGAASLVWVKPGGRGEPVDIEHLWNPLRTRLSGISLPENPAILYVYRKPIGYA